MALGEELAVLAHLHKTQDFSAASALWKCKLMPAGMLVQQQGKQETWLCLGTHSLCVLLWPAEKRRLGQSVLWGPKAISSVTELWVRPLTDYSEWVAIPSKFVSPLHVFILNGAKVPSSWPETCMLQ